MDVEPIAKKTKLNEVLVKPWHLAVIFSCAFLFLMVTMNIMDTRMGNMVLFLYDEGLILFDSVRILSGDVPYRDFYTNYGPAQFYILAALFKLFGASVIIERVWDLVIRSSTIVIIYLIIIGAWGRKTALFTAIVVAFWLTSFGSYGYPVFPCLFFSLLSLYCTLPIFKERREIIFPLASGACIGMVALFRYDVAVLAVVAGLFTLELFNLAQTKTHNKKKVLERSAIAYICGILLVSVPVLFLLLSAVGFHDIWSNLVGLHISTYVHNRHLPLFSVDRIVHYTTDLGVYLPFLGLFSVVVVFSSGTKKLLTEAEDVRKLILLRRWILVQLCAFSALFFVKGFVRASINHMALSIVPALMILCVTIKQRRQTYYSKTSAFFIWFVFVCLIILFFPALRYAYIQFTQNAEWVLLDIHRKTGTGICSPPDGLERMRCFPPAYNRVVAIRYIQQRTKENDYIYVGTGRHDKILVNDILFYFASKRLSATKWHQFDPGITNTKDIQSEIISDLCKHHPRYVILTSLWDNWHEGNASDYSSGVHLLDDFLRTNYRLVAVFGDLQIGELIN